MAKRIINSEPPKFALENAYEAIREMADAYLYKDGFKSFSHEASIIYLEKLKMPASLVAKADWLRKRRIGIKYYGEDATMEEAQEAILIAEEMFKRLKG